MKKTIMFLLGAFLIGSLNAQDYRDFQKKVDSFLLEWNTPNDPGGSIGVMKGEEIIYHKAFGHSSLDYMVPNKVETMFNTASVSKQFTAMAMVLLHLEGKLSLDDDIRKHVPDIPDFGTPITIKHMLHHTSGMRSLHALLELAGWRADDNRTNADIYRFMARQKELNFEPGAEHLYCNTGYMLCARIVEKITGETFIDWMKKNVFDPLGMTQTYVQENYQLVIPGNASSYYDTDIGFQRAIDYWEYVGSGNTHSTTGDLLLWLKNFYSPKPGWEKAFAMMETMTPFNNGEVNTYAFGINVGALQGSKRIGHGGSIGGFRSYVCVFPEQELSIAVLANFSSANPQFVANNIARMLLPEDEEPAEDAGGDDEGKREVSAVSLQFDELKKNEGNYWQDKDNYSRKIYLKDDTLRYNRGGDNESAIVPMEDGSFKMLNVGVDLRVRFQIGKKMVVTVDGGSPIESEYYEQEEFEEKDLEEYAGYYYSDELEATYRIYTKEGKLWWHHSRHGDHEMRVLKKDVLEGAWPFVIVKVKRGDDYRIKGVRVTNGRVRNAWFEKDR